MRDRFPLIVVGAHLRNQPLNHQLTDVGAEFGEATTTAPHYRLYALPDTTPPKPGLVRVTENGCAIAIEIWHMPSDQVGRFLAQVPHPLAIGQLETAAGQWLHGFVVEPLAIVGAEDISHHGGWVAWLAQR